MAEADGGAGQGRGGGGAAGPPCLRCPRALGRSCCEVGEGDHLATLTRADVARIAAHARLAPARFLEEEWLLWEEAHAYEERRTLYRGYFRHAPVRLTLQARGGACVFHTAARGCSLPADVRPTACLLYPFERWPDGTWGLQVERLGSLEEARAAGGAACLAVEEAQSVEGLAETFGTTLPELESLAARLRDEVLQHARSSGRT
jgi:hypothetical protein